MGTWSVIELDEISRLASRKVAPDLVVIVVVDTSDPYRIRGLCGRKRREPEQEDRQDNDEWKAECALPEAAGPMNDHFDACQHHISRRSWLEAGWDARGFSDAMSSAMQQQRVERKRG